MSYRTAKKCSAHPELYDHLEKCYSRMIVRNKIKDFIVGICILIMAGAIVWLAVSK